MSINMNVKNEVDNYSSTGVSHLWTWCWDGWYRSMMRDWNDEKQKVYSKQIPNDTNQKFTARIETTEKSCFFSDIFILFMFYNITIYICVCKFQCFVRRKPTYSHSQGTFVQLVFQLLWLHSAVSLSSLGCCNVHLAYLIATNKHTLGHMLSSRIDQNSIEQLYNAPFSTNSTFTSSYRALLRFCGFLVASKWLRTARSPRRRKPQRTPCQVT